MEETEILQVRSDRLFKDLFNEYEMDTLEWTVMQILNCSHDEIKGQVTVDNVRLNSISTSERVKVVDLKVKYKNNTILIELNNDDLLIITADHGNDPTWHGTDHTRETIPVGIYNKTFTKVKRLDDLSTFADIGATIADNFNITMSLGTSFLDNLK